MQNNVVMAFRKRLKKYGYRDISIRQVRNDNGATTGEYTVTAVEPLGGTVVHVYYTLMMMHHAFKGRGAVQQVSRKPPGYSDTAKQVSFDEFMAIAV